MLCSLLAIDRAAAVVVAFPRGREILESGDVGGGVLQVQTITARKKPVESIPELGLVGDVADDRAERLELASALRHEQAERLADVEADTLARSRQLPVHREGGDG